MKLGLYPGSFNPFHKGHYDILTQATQLFDKVIVVTPQTEAHDFTYLRNNSPEIEIGYFDSTLVKYSQSLGATAIIRGLRNSSDLEYERSMLYWNEDLGLQIPTIYIICDRKLVHISSSAIRAIKELKND